MYVETESLHVRIANFGLATTLKSTNAFRTQTMGAGTLGFQASKQLRSEGIFNKCDVYAFGGLLVELFGEKPLWDQVAPHTIMFMVAVNKVSKHCTLI